MSQIFRKDIPNDILFKFLEDNAEKTHKCYIVNNVFYKKLQFNNELYPFLQSLMDYYHLSKQYYLTRKMSYTKFITVIRQICKQNNLSFTSNIKYDKSKYNINYFIFF